jgi:E3 ubiquitin-protein ligase TRIP12
LKVEAQTPDGTRVATPKPAKNAPPAAIARAASAGKASYAAALKAKPTDWHIEFSIDGQALPLDMTIYGAIHQQEMRKATGAPFAAALIWQGIHAVKFRKVPGPAPSVESTLKRFHKYCQCLT